MTYTATLNTSNKNTNNCGKLKYSWRSDQWRYFCFSAWNYFSSLERRNLEKHSFVCTRERERESGQTFPSSRVLQCHCDMYTYLVSQLHSPPATPYYAAKTMVIIISIILNEQYQHQSLLQSDLCNYSCVTTANNASSCDDKAGWIVAFSFLWFMTDQWSIMLHY